MNPGKLQDPQKATTVWHLQRGEAGIAWLSINCRQDKLNTLDQRALAALSEIIDELNIDLPTGLVLSSGKAAGFIAGAQIKEFTQIESRSEAAEMMSYAHHIFNRIEAMPIPKVVLIHGACLGGGLELALCFDYLIAEDDPGCKLGLPEVKLGIHPGYGGSVRLSERIGVTRAMPMMLSGRLITARSARKTGLLDQLLAKRYFHAAARDYIVRKPEKLRAGGYDRLWRLSPARRLMAAYMHRELRKKVRPDHYPAPFALLELWKNFGGNRDQMLQQEINSVAGLAVGDTARNLVRIFFLQEQLKATNRQFVPAEIRRLHVIGAGVMGGDIAAWSALQGIRVTLQDQNTESIARAMARAHKLFQRKLKIKRLVQAAMDRLMPDPQGIGVAKADVIIEAIFENLQAKQALLSEVESAARKDALIASNTSSIPIELIAESLKKPQRLVGIHFFNPVAKMQLLEIVAGEQSGATELAMAKAYCLQISRLPVRVSSHPGFLVNRVLMPYLIEAVTMLDEGLAAETIDQAALAFGMPMGPIELADVVGLDICLHVAENLPGKQPIPQSLIAKVKAGQLGSKSGQGYYYWDKGRPEHETQTAVEGGEALAARMLYPMINECVACLREGVVGSADELDAGVIFGTGFAPFKGGPMQLAKTLGHDQVVEQLQLLSRRHGARFTPDPGWEDSHIF